MAQEVCLELQAIVDKIVGYVWSTPLVVLCLGAGIFFSIRTRFLQIRLIRDMVRQLLGGHASKRGVSSFQGFAMALGGRVGTGNIAGVATAICFGGPGALFWMWMIAFLGAGSAYIEAALAQVWKEEIGGVYRGGPPYYIELGLGQKWYAVIFAIITVISCGILLPGRSLGDVERQPKDVLVGLAEVDEAGGNKRIHKPGQLELANPIRIQFPPLVADHGDLQPVPDLELGDQLDHLAVGFRLREHEAPKLSPGERSLLVEDDPT
jgi:hypothetical protein